MVRGQAQNVNNNHPIPNPSPKGKGVRKPSPLGEKRTLGASQDSLRFFAKKSNEWTAPVRRAGWGVFAEGALLLLLFFLPLTSNATAPTNGLVAHYAFEEQSGATAGDSSPDATVGGAGNGNNGTINGASWVGGKVGGALGFE